jgi:predicted PurR-regulated permease PerM
LQSWAEQLQIPLGTIVAQVGSWPATGVGAVGSLVTVLVVATFFTLFVLTSGDTLWRSVLGHLPEAFRRLPTRHSGRICARPVTGSTPRPSLVSSAASHRCRLLVLQVPLAVAIGALTFALGYVPMIGATVAGVWPWRLHWSPAVL